MTMVFLAAPAVAQLRPLKVPAVDEHTTASGLRVLAVRRGPLPLVSIRLMVQAGSGVHPPGKHRLEGFTARLLRRGTKGMTADQINEAVEYVGGSLAVGAAEDFMAVSITAPSEHFEAMMRVMGQLVLEPTFPPEEVESQKRRVLAQI